MDGFHSKEAPESLAHYAALVGNADQAHMPPEVRHFALVALSTLLFRTSGALAVTDLYKT